MADDDDTGKPPKSAGKKSGEEAEAAGDISGKEKEDAGDKTGEQAAVDKTGQEEESAVDKTGQEEESAVEKTGEEAAVDKTGQEEESAVDNTGKEMEAAADGFLILNVSTPAELESAFESGNRNMMINFCADDEVRIEIIERLREGGKDRLVTIEPTLWKEILLAGGFIVLAAVGTYFLEGSLNVKAFKRTFLLAGSIIGGIHQVIDGFEQLSGLGRIVRTRVTRSATITSTGPDEAGNLRINAGPKPSPPPSSGTGDGGDKENVSSSSKGTKSTSVDKDDEGTTKDSASSNKQNSSSGAASTSNAADKKDGAPRPPTNG